MRNKDKKTTILCYRTMSDFINQFQNADGGLLLLCYEDDGTAPKNIEAATLTGKLVLKDIHFLFGYFSTQAMQYLLEPLELPRGLKIATPILVFSGLAAMKEWMLDGTPDINDFKAGIYGMGIAVVSFKIVFTIK